MDYDVLEARYLGGYRVWLRFQDGTEGEIDLESRLWGAVFEPIRNPDRFRQFRVDPISRTLVWPNGADLAPETLHDLVRAIA
jgi:hypothetical protein